MGTFILTTITGLSFSGTLLVIRHYLKHGNMTPSLVTWSTLMMFVVFNMYSNATYQDFFEIENFLAILIFLLPIVTMTFFAIQRFTVKNFLNNGFEMSCAFIIISYIVIFMLYKVAGLSRWYFLERDGLYFLVPIWLGIWLPTFVSVDVDSANEPLYFYAVHLLVYLVLVLSVGLASVVLFFAVLPLSIIFIIITLNMRKKPANIS